ncbi:MAG: hypothetical protein FJ012_00415 [Chloroflexi bacterium]|nr:hypothetical protein [Chloroflexota bacterium]
MGDTYITDITHFEGLPPKLAKGPAGRIARYFGSIVSAASVVDRGVWRDSAIRCRRRPGRKPCLGQIRIYRTGHSTPIQWHCSSCDDQGVISNWKESSWDLSQNLERQDSAARSGEILVSDEQLRELRNILIVDRVNQRVIDAAKVTSGGFVLCGSEDNFEDLLGYIAEEADSERNSHRCQILEQVCERIEDFLLERLDEDIVLQRDEQDNFLALNTEAQNFFEEIQKHFD